MAIVRKTFAYGGRTVTLETKRIARQATAAVWASIDDTVVLVTVVAKKQENVYQDFFPMTVHYQERLYATGILPGGYLRREGRLTEKETLTSRLIDRPIRPLFPKGFHNEVQIIATVMSSDTDVDPDIISLLGASAALALSGLPFKGPVGAARVGYIDGQYVLNPGYAQLKTSDLDMVVAGTDKAVLMVESEANILSEEIMLGGVMFAHEQMQIAIQAIKELAAEAGLPAWDWQAPAVDQHLSQRVSDFVENELAAAYKIQDKIARLAEIKILQKKTIEKFLQETQEESSVISETQLMHLFNALEKKIVRKRVLAGEPRIDGRNSKTVRPIAIETGLLPRVHGSALFTRGETQAIVTATLGTERDAQMIDALEGKSRDNFMLHYNFPPYCVGETGMMAGPKRREVGHGRLARRGIEAVLPSIEDFSYVIRVVSEITESNGSSSMASACGASLALMDAGVPIQAHVAGIAMGLVKEGEQYAILTDILGDEDHLGDMDFKVIGTFNGITALQMDIKIDGITREIMEKALAQAREARLHILGLMEKSLPHPRTEMSAYAPRIVQLQISVDKIREVIGKGGVMIRALTEQTGAVIDITDKGLVKIAASDLKVCEDALRRIKALVAEPEVGQIYEGKVEKIAEFGAFVSFLPGQQGLVHISQISQERVSNVIDILSEGQKVRVKVIEIDRTGRVRLSMKEVSQDSIATS